MIDKYIETRRKAGEKITEESYLIRNDYDYLSQDKIRNPEPLTANALVSLIDRLITEIGLKKTNYKTQDYKYQRHDKALFHAFRKFFETCLEECNVNAGAIVKLMGWNQDLRSVYNRPAEKILLTEYLKAVNELTINEENRLRKRVEKLEVEKSIVDQMAVQLKELRQKMGIES
jgi:integrase/recombinase XerD